MSERTMPDSWIALWRLGVAARGKSDGSGRDGSGLRGDRGEACNLIMGGGTVSSSMIPVVFDWTELEGGEGKGKINLEPSGGGAGGGDGTTTARIGPVALRELRNRGRVDEGCDRDANGDVCNAADVGTEESMG